MNCFPEFTYSVYSDGELPVEEAREVELHLAECPDCQLLLERLRLENRMIGEVLAETRDERETLPEWEPASPSRLIFGALAALAGAVLGLRSAFVGLANWSIAEYSFLDPFIRAL